MNSEMILRVADAIETAAKPDAKPAMGFNMSAYITPTMFDDHTGHDCGTVACIAGWVLHVDGMSVSDIRETDLDEAGFRVPELAEEKLGLSSQEARQLFHPDLAGLVWGRIEVQQAVAVLRHLAQTGVVDWSIAVEVTA